MKLIRLLLFLSLLLALPIRGTAAPRPAQTGQTELTFAYFPLAVPISVLGETMQRDRIMQRNLERWKGEFVSTAKSLVSGTGWVILAYAPRDNSRLRC